MEHEAKIGLGSMILWAFLFTSQTVFLKWFDVGIVYQTTLFALAIFIPCMLSVLYYNHKATENKAALQAHQVKLFDTIHMQRKSAESLDKQVEIEKADKVDFETFLSDYFGR